VGLFGKGGGASGGMKAGFRDLKWGDQPRADMEVLDEQAEQKFCRLEHDNLTWSDAPVDRIVYLFWNNRFSDVHIEIPTASADRILKDLNDGWGRPEQPNKFIEDFVWKNKAIGPEATEALFSRNPNTRAATLAISSSYIKAKKALAKAKPPAR
jgi:hypothetical protein